jgi:hypothetical protein
MPKKVIIIGAGLTGLVTGYVLNKFGNIGSITFVDAAPSPKESTDTFFEGHTGATLGHGCDARHFTGTEGLSLQNPVHTKLLFESSSSGGWCSIEESGLTEREKAWREECIERYKTANPSKIPYDDTYTILNYAGMESWNLLRSLDQTLDEFLISPRDIYVAFQTKEAMQNDFESESSFNRLKNDNISIVEQGILGAPIHATHSELLRVPGSTWRIQSVWKYFYRKLSNEPNVHFEWNRMIEEELPDGDAYVWAIGSTHNVPELYRKKSRVQGLGGAWIQIKNPGFKESFKISAPHPSGYINFTPDGEVLSISGGFGWIGERNFQEAEKLLKPVEQKLIEHVSMFLAIPKDELKKHARGFCIRPATPTCLPDIQNFFLNGKQHIMISGGGKAGATQAPLLALHVAQNLGIDTGTPLTEYARTSPDSAKIVATALQLLKKGLEPEKDS